MRRFILILIMILSLVPAAAWCAEGQIPEGVEVVEMDLEEPAADEAVDEFAELPPEHYSVEPFFDMWLGYRFFDFSGVAERAAEYEWPHSSPAGGLRLHNYPLPHRFDTEFDVKNHNDYEAEFAYAYKDVFKINYIGWALWHNLDHLVLEPDTMRLDMNSGEHYHVTVRDNRAFLRLKMPEKAHHLFIDYRSFTKDGKIQKTFYNGLGNKVSRTRNIDWETSKVTAGINGHLGPVELEYSHLFKRFSPNGNVRLVDSIVSPGFAPGPVVHGVLPSFETNADTIKAHTDLTGRVMAAATFTAGEKNNGHSQAEVKYNRAYGDLTLIPFKDVTVAIKYRFKELTESVPRIVSVPTVFFPASSTKMPINSRSNQADVTVRYSPISAFCVKAVYSFENVKRNNTALWSDSGIVPFQGIPSDQNTHKIKLGTHTKPVRGLNLGASVEYAYTEDPAYPTKPRNSYKGRFNADWTPAASVTAGAHYRFTAEENSTANMRSRWDNAGGQVVWTPTARMFLSGSYDYFRYKNVRDLILTVGSPVDDSEIPDRVPYRDIAHVYSIGAGYDFLFPLTLEAEFHQSWTEGMFRTGASIFSVPLGMTVTTDGIGELVDQRVRETGGSITGRYEIYKGWGTSLTYRVNDYEDLEDKPQDGDQDGTAHTVLVMLTKKW